MCTCTKLFKINITNFKYFKTNIDEYDQNMLHATLKKQQEKN